MPLFPVDSDFSSYPDAVEQRADGFTLLAPAKVNLALRVIGRRPDGYHDIETVFQEIALYDRMEFHTDSGWSLEVRGAGLTAGEDNLVTRAARVLSAAAGIACCGRIVLEKKIPVGGGLGGGSSDAAVALIGLSRLWELNWSAARLHPLAAQVGSDCPFFLYGGLAHGSGRGERIELWEGKVGGTLALIVPPFGVSTAQVYAAGGFPLTDERKSAIFKFRQEEYETPAAPPPSWSNDLENIVLSRHAELGTIRQKLLDFGAERSMLSGSGSVVFGLFMDSARATHAAQQFGPPYRVIITSAVHRRRGRFEEEDYEHHRGQHQPP